MLIDKSCQPHVPKNVLFMLEESKHFRKGGTQTKEVKANCSDDLKFLRADQRAFEICLVIGLES